MINKQYKLSERQLQIERQWSDFDLLAFTAYFKVNSVLAKCRITTYDYDTNLKFIKKSQKNVKADQSMFSLKSKKQSEKSVQSKSNLTKSARPKIQTIKKQDMPMFHDPNSQLISILPPASNMKQELKYDHKLPFFISQQSNISQQNKSNSLNIVEQNTSKLNHILNDTFSYQEGSPEQEEQQRVVLPMLQKIEHSQKLYLGEKAKNIETLNQFIVQPSHKDTSKFINNKIDKEVVDKSNRKQKIEGFRIALPQSHQSNVKKEQELKTNEYMNGYRIVESRLIQEVRQQKSKSKPKKIKDSTIHLIKPKFKQPFKQFSSQKEKNQTPTKNQAFLQPNRQKLTPTKSHNKAKPNKSNPKINKNQVIPVQDYDQVFDESRQKVSPQNIEEMSQCQQNIRINQMPQAVKHNFCISARSNGSESKQSNKFQRDQITQDPHLQFFAIPLQKIKQNKPKEKNVQQLKPQKFVEDYRKDQLQQNLKHEMFKKKQVSQRSSRKKIFSQLQREVKQKRQKEAVQKSQSSTIDMAQYTEQQMRMILGAKGNKYKQMIIKQYIRINRATHKQNTSQ